MSEICGVPMYPGGPECLREPGHLGSTYRPDELVHYVQSSGPLRWTYTACWKEHVLGRRCILELGHPPLDGVTDAQREAIRWFWSDNSDDVTLAEVRARFASVGLATKEKLNEAIARMLASPS